MRPLHFSTSAPSWGQYCSILVLVLLRGSISPTKNGLVAIAKVLKDSLVLMGALDLDPAEFTR